MSFHYHPSFAPWEAWARRDQYRHRIVYLALGAWHIKTMFVWSWEGRDWRGQRRILICRGENPFQPPLGLWSNEQALRANIKIVASMKRYPLLSSSDLVCHDILSSNLHSSTHGFSWGQTQGRRPLSLVTRPYGSNERFEDHGHMFKVGMLGPFCFALGQVARDSFCPRVV